MDAPPKSVKVAAPVSMACARCDTALTQAGAQRLNDGGAGALGALLGNHDHLEAFVCPRCGRVELFVVGVGEEHRGEPAGGGTASVVSTVESLLRDAGRHEMRDEAEAAVAGYEQVKARYPGTEYAREAEERLCAIRTKYGL